MRITPIVAATLLLSLACGGGGPSADPGELADAESLDEKWTSPDEHGWNKAIVLTDDNDVLYIGLSKYVLLAREDGRVLRRGSTCEMGSGSVEPFQFAHDGGANVRFACSRGGGVLLDAKTGQISEAEAPPIEEPDTEGYSTGSWVDSATEWRGMLVTAGSDGVVIHGSNKAKLLTLTDQTATGVDADEHGICAGFRDGMARCWSDGELPKSTYVAPPTTTPGKTGDAASAANGGSTTAANSAPTGAKQTHEGTIARKSGNTVVLKTTGGASPSKGAKGTLSKQVNKQMMGMNITAWLNIAEVEVTSTSGGQVTCTVTDELTDITVNGQKQDQFTPGAKTQLTW